MKYIFSNIIQFDALFIAYYLSTIHTYFLKLTNAHLDFSRRELLHKSTTPFCVASTNFVINFQVVLAKLQFPTDLLSGV